MINLHAPLTRAAEGLMPEAAAHDEVVLAQDGDLTALGALYDKHYGPIFRYLRARLDDPHAAEDLTGEVFKRMLTGLRGYRPQGLPFRAWLFGIAHNLLVDHYRRTERANRAARHDAQQGMAQGVDPAAFVEQTLTYEDAHRALARLEEHQRDVVTLRFLSGLSLRETALALGKTEDAVKALQRRGLAALRLALMDESE